MNSIVSATRSQRSPTIGTPKRSFAADRISVICMAPTIT